ncbi:MAG TPA: peptidyl-prolyl cis-trans isomerase [Pseudonocardiaceae bacterium]|jgi:peptidyl-prolyl cis-trans isomerase C|nr:peptidyl-prolyl cis-trans isomerase [Pseudonocardiaceae bacterium]
MKFPVSGVVATARLVVTKARRGRLLPTSRIARIVLIGLLALVACGSGANLAIARLNELPAGAVFRADGVIVTDQQLQHRITLMEFVYGLQPPTDPAAKDQFNRDVAKALAVSQITDDAARARGIVIADKAASDQLNTLIQQNSWTDQSTLIKQLGAQGLSEQDVLDEIKRQQASARLFAQVTGSVRASTDADAQAYYNQNKSQMVSPEQRAIANIVVSSQAQAQQITQLAQSGSDFAALAKQYSIDGSTKSNGGSLGVVSSSQLEAGYAKAAFAARDNSVFGPVQTTQGWNVGEVTDVHQPVPLTFAQVKDAIRTKLDNDAKLKVWDAFLTGKIMAAHVVYVPAYQPADPNSPPPASSSSS